MAIKILLVLLLSLFFVPALAADCTAVDQVLWDESAVQMMWSIRAWLCPNAWWESITAGPEGNWCNSAGGIVYSGSFTITGMANEQECWDTTEQIIDQCMYFEYIEASPGIQSGNGGTWSYGSTYAGGWFWAVTDGVCSNEYTAKKRDTEPTPTYTLESGEKKSVKRQVWLDVSDLSAPQLVTERIYE